MLALKDIRRTQAGFTLIEVMVAALVLVVGVLAVIGLLNAANGATSRTRDHDTATNLARELIESRRVLRELLRENAEKIELV